MSNPISPDQIQQLIEAARAAQAYAYIPYSHYAVGAALLAANGQVYTGCNVENAAYPSGICAERVALVKAVSEGARRFDTLVVITRDGGSPCGMCRQMLSEFGLDLRVVVVDQAGKPTFDGTLADLLPHAFTPTSLDA